MIGAARFEIFNVLFDKAECNLTCVTFDMRDSPSPYVAYAFGSTEKTSDTTSLS